MYQTLSDLTAELPCSFTGLPRLGQLQRATRTMKKAKVAGVQITSMLELKQFLLPIAMPSALSALVPVDDEDGGELTTAPSRLLQEIQSNKLVHVPMDNYGYNVHGAVLTGPMQVHWIGQLAKMPNQFVLHADSKFKLHHGGWVLTTVGTHWLRWDGHNHTLSTSFAPLMYLFCQEKETNGSALMVLEALNVTSLKYYGVKLEPGATMSDHCDAFKAAFEAVFPNAPFGQCWPHIKRKWHEGQYASKSWEHFDEVADQLTAIHLAHTVEMRDLLTTEYGDVWDSWGHQMDVFWDSYCRAPWDNWSVGLFQCMLCTPSQQTHETWHKQLLQSKIPGLFHGSTAAVFASTLPQLIEMDALQIPTELVFHVPAVPAAMIKKALWYVDNRDTHIYTLRDADGDFSYYVMRRDNASGYKKWEPRLFEMHEHAREGEKDRRIKDLKHLADVCNLFHLIMKKTEEWSVPRCEYNPMELDCVYCKGFKGYGICSHVLAINHICREINLRAELLEMGKSKLAKVQGGNRTKAKPALTKQKQIEPDSSDEELERLLDQGAQGK